MPIISAFLHEVECGFINRTFFASLLTTQPWLFHQKADWQQLNIPVNTNINDHGCIRSGDTRKQANTSQGLYLVLRQNSSFSIRGVCRDCPSSVSHNEPNAFGTPRVVLHIEILMWHFYHKNEMPAHLSIWKLLIFFTANNTRTIIISCLPDVKVAYIQTNLSGHPPLNEWLLYPCSVTWHVLPCSRVICCQPLSNCTTTSISLESVITLVQFRIHHGAPFSCTD